MIYGDFDDFASTSSSKTIKVYRNGDHTLSFDLKLPSDYKARDIFENIESRLKLQGTSKMRLFTIEGLEITPEDMKYLKSGEVVFVSQGENFDKSSTLAEYEIIRPLGEGGFGQVLLATHKRTKEQVAIKFQKISSRILANEVNKLFAEAEMLKNLHHKNIVKIINCFSLSSMQVAFIMEYLDGGELLEYVLKRERLNEEEAHEFFTQIAGAISYCHRNRLIHCDLKLENILLESKDSKNVKIVDFGISGLSTPNQNEAGAGSLDYMAPEYFNGSTKGVHAGVDVWALGCMLYGMVCGKLPFRDSSDAKIIEKICSGKVEYSTEDDKKLSREIKDLIRKMLEVDPEQRVNIHDVISHPWITGQKLPEIVEEEKNEAEKKAETQNISIPIGRKSVNKQATYTFGAKTTGSPSDKKSPSSNIERSPKMNVTGTSPAKKSDLSKAGKKV